MLYKQKRVKLPKGMKIGSQVGILGDGESYQTITDIIYSDDGHVQHVVLSNGWREPLAKIYLINPRRRPSACFADRRCWIDVAIGECDICGEPFSDSCQYHQPEDNSGGMICPTCHEKSGCKTRPGCVILF